jgi:hypothetical protein
MRLQHAAGGSFRMGNRGGAFKCLASDAAGGYTPALSRSVAQPGRALCSGRRGRRFESSHSDQEFQDMHCAGGMISAMACILL